MFMGDQFKMTKSIELVPISVGNKKEFKAMLVDGNRRPRKVGIVNIVDNGGFQYCTNNGDKSKVFQTKAGLFKSLLYGDE
jgi:hypothetical protein